MAAMSAWTSETSRRETSSTAVPPLARQRIERVTIPVRRSSDRSYASTVPVARSSGSSPTISWMPLPSATLSITW